MNDPQVRDLDADNRSVYATRYTAAHMVLGDRCAYDREMVALRFRILEPYARGARIVDFGCGTGSYLLSLATTAREAVGIDFSRHLLDELRAVVVREGRANVRILEENIKQTSLESNGYDLAFSIATLYTVPEPERALREMRRVLRPGGIAVFELGNRWSLNTIANRFHPYGITVHDMGTRQMDACIRRAGFSIVERRAFQVLPMWGQPRWLWPFVTPLWKIPMAIRIGDKVLDEVISSSFPFRMIAFRHLFVCVRQ